MTKDRVSGLCRGLDESVAAFRDRQGEFPYLWLDAKHLRVRSQGHVRSKALVVAYAVHDSGRLEVIGIDLGEVETEAFWVEFLRRLRARGLQGVRLAVSDHHEGLKTAISKILGCPWQRCTVHFVRNMHGHCRRSERGLQSDAQAPEPKRRPASTSRAILRPAGDDQRPPRCADVSQNAELMSRYSLQIATLWAVQTLLSKLISTFLQIRT